MAKDAKGHGSDKRGGGKPLEGHDYHRKSDAELHYIMRDAHSAAKNAQGMGDAKGEGKYLDQINDASSVMGYRQRGGQRETAAHQSGVGGIRGGLGTGLQVDWSKHRPNPYEGGGFASQHRARRLDKARDYVKARASRPSNFRLT